MARHLSRRRFLKTTAAAAAGMWFVPGWEGSATRLWACIPPEDRPQPEQWEHTTVSLAWIGHATVLINLVGKWILTDPVLMDRIGIDLFGVATLGPKRVFAPALRVEQLPKPDVVLLSHAHMDHLDIASLRALTARFPKQLSVVTAANTADVIEDLPWKEIIELDWNERVMVDGVALEAIPVKHFGWRFPWERDRSRGWWKGRSYNAYLLERRGKVVVFGGDTAMTRIFQRYADVDIAVMPIGAYQPWRHMHCTPEEAIAMAQMMGAQVVAPIHCTTFAHGREPFWEPPKRFLRAIRETSLQPAWIRVGQSFIL